MQEYEPYIEDEEEDDDDLMNLISKNLDYSSEQTQRTQDEQLERLVNHDWNRNSDIRTHIAPENQAKAAMLMKEFAQGGYDVLLALKKRNKLSPDVEIPLPTIENPDTQRDDGSKLVSNSVVQLNGKIEKDSASVTVHPDFLGLFYDSDPQRMRQLEIKGEIIAHATAYDFMYATGVEEYAELALRYIGTNLPETKMDRIKIEGSTKHGLVKYDARRHEYQSLGWRIRALMDRRDQSQDSQEKEALDLNISVLKERLSKAAKLRRQVRQNNS